MGAHIHAEIHIISDTVLTPIIGFGNGCRILITNDQFKAHKHVNFPSAWLSWWQWRKRGDSHNSVYLKNKIYGMHLNKSFKTPWPVCLHIIPQTCFMQLLGHTHQHGCHTEEQMMGLWEANPAPFCSNSESCQITPEKQAKATWSRPILGPQAPSLNWLPHS